MRLFPISQGILSKINEQSQAAQTIIEKIASQNELVHLGEYPSEKVRADAIKSDLQADRAIARNVGDAKTLFQISEGALNESHNLIMRLKELALQASNEWMGYEEREIIDQEAYQLKQEIERIALTTHYRNQFLLNGEGKEYTFQVGQNNDESSRLSFSSSNLDARASSLGVDNIDLTTADSSLDAISSLNEGLRKIQTARSYAGSFHSRLESLERQNQNKEEAVASQLSRLTDVDVARASTEWVKRKIALESSVALLGQANNLQRANLKLIDF